MSLDSENIPSTVSHVYLTTIVGRTAEILFFLGVFTVLPLEEVGVYSWSLAVSAFFAIALDLGINQLALREFSQHSLPLPLATRAITFVRGPLVLVGAAVLGGWALYTGASQTDVIALLLACVTQAFVVTENFFFAWLKGTSKQVLANRLGLLDPIGRLVFLGATVLVFDSVLSAVSLLALVLALHLLLLPTVAFVATKEFRILFRKQIQFPSLSLGTTAKRLATTGIVFSLIGVVAVVQTRLDWLLVSSLSSRVELANYSLANKGYEILQMFIGTAMLTVYPWLCRRDSSFAFRNRLNVTISFVFASGIVLALSAAIYVPVVLEWIWGDKYSAAIPMLHLLLLALCLATAIMVLHYPLLAAGYEKQVLGINLFGAIFQTITNIVLIPNNGAYGAIAGMAVLGVANVSGYTLLARRYGVITEGRMYGYLSYFLLISLLAAVIWYTEANLVIGLLTLSLSGYGLGYALLTNNNEKAALLGWIKRIMQKFTQEPARP